MILRRITDETGSFSRNHYTLQVNPNRSIVTDLQRRGIQVISIQCDPDLAAVNEAVSKWIRELYEKILRSPTRAQLSAGTTPALNNNIPVPAHSRLFGRTGEINALMEALSTSGYSIVTIDGFAGVGKTALAHDVGIACSSGYAGAPKFEYVVWVSANKPNQKRWFKDVMNAVATVTRQRFSESEQTYTENKYQLVDSKTVLIIINNYEVIDDPELSEWIEHLPDPSRILITTQQVMQLERCWHISLQGLRKPDAVEFAQEHARALGFLYFFQNRDIESLAEVSAGNPQVIKLTLGLVKGGTKTLSDVVGELRGIPGRTVHDTLLEALFAWSWSLLSDDAKKLLLTTTHFVGTSVIRLEALHEVSEIESADFERALGQLLEFKLLEPTYDGRFVTHSMTRAFARKKIEERPELRTSGRQACIKYFLKFVEQNVKREQPPAPYWNALVTDRMRNIDPEWPCIQAAIDWSSDEELIAFIQLLVHYMDSRFLNEERIKYVSRALTALRKFDRKEEEALLRIDALGWTFVELDRRTEALDQIVQGLEIARSDDLRALGLAWHARVLVELEQFREANKKISDALQKTTCSPWIWHRVNMAAGDIAMKQGRFQAAHQHYSVCAKVASEYGDEGHGYQIGPRLGLACLRLERFDEAETHFEDISHLEQITVGRMYAEYGLALVAHARGEFDKARDLLGKVRDQLSSRTSSSLLLRLINELSGELAEQARLPERTGSATG